jgi:uncharacterized protein (UPF0332 family)
VAAARAELQAERLNGAGNRAYYAMFHAARAALERRGIDTRGQRHGAVLREFSRLFVGDGPLAREHGRSIRKAQELRNIGDYDEAPPDRDDVAAAVENAEAFVDAVGSLPGT